ncbi:hypothetical protein [Aliikangiella coralliicola]|uniref:Uncharacterized protein n=1 Tax=Aliikangiella coralliicola TaxID=2592383 RepID=A0A545UK80_9GAMM|nr:hypothetical protein [Aliikangiella coralliicola]TQV89853.1 hypothetical protein FLL46_02980 [Aliikangiella coralliicola]
MLNKQSIAEVLQLLLPPEAEVEFDFDREGFFASFCWLLNSDPERPFKRSKKVHFIITREALEDFKNVGNKNEARLQLDFETYINHKLDLFDPNHNAPEGVAPPVEKWVIDSLLFIEALEKLKGVKRPIF